MLSINDSNSLQVPLFSELDAIGFGEHKKYRHFNTGTLFWSLTRLFGCYERVMEGESLPREGRPFLESDIENYIIRFRIVLNDIAYVVWQLLPNSRGLKGPGGRTHPKNREVSIFTLEKFLFQKASTYPEMARAFSNAMPWMTRLKNDRDNVVHYKSQVVVFEGKPVSFALINAAGTQHITEIEGESRLHLVPLKDFVNDQMVSLHNFMHIDLACAVREHAKSHELKIIHVGTNQRMSCIGIERFRKLNAI